MKIRSKHIAIFSGIILFLASLGVYSTLRSGTLEKEYVSIVTLKNSEILKLIGDPIIDKSADKGKLEASLKNIKDTIPGTAIVAVADNDYNVIIAGKNSTHAPRKDTLDSIISDFNRKKLVPRTSFPLLIRYYDQSRFYIFINEIDSKYVLTAFPYMMTERQIVSFALETVLLAIVFIIITMSAIIIIEKRESGRDKTKTQGRHDLKQTQSKKTRDHDENVRMLFFIMEECAGLVHANRILLEIFSREDNVFYTSMEYHDGKVTIPGHGRQGKRKLHGELVAELERSSMVLLDKNTTCLVPLVKKGNIEGIVRIERDTPFNGKDMKRVEDYIATHIDTFLQVTNTA